MRAQDCGGNRGIRLHLDLILKSLYGASIVPITQDGLTSTLRAWNWGGIPG